MVVMIIMMMIMILIMDDNDDDVAAAPSGRLKVDGGAFLGLGTTRRVDRVGDVHVAISRNFTVMYEYTKSTKSTHVH